MFDIFSLDMNEIVFNINDNPWLTNTNNNPVTSSLLHESKNTNNELFGGTNNSCQRPSTALQKILQQLYNDDYAQFPCVSCAYCSRLLYPNSIKWITGDGTYTYPFESSFPDTLLFPHPNNPSKNAICSSYKIKPNNRSSRRLALIPTISRMLKENISLLYTFTPVQVARPVLMRLSNIEQ